MVKKIKKVKKERLEDILWACRVRLRGKAENATLFDVAFRTQGVRQ